MVKGKKKRVLIYSEKVMRVIVEIFYCDLKIDFIGVFE